MFGCGMITVLFTATSHDVTERHLSDFFPLIIFSVLHFFDYRLNKLIRFFGGVGVLAQDPSWALMGGSTPPLKKRRLMIVTLIFKLQDDKKFDSLIR